MAPHAFSRPGVKEPGAFHQAVMGDHGEGGFYRDPIKAKDEVRLKDVEGGRGCSRPFSLRHASTTGGLLFKVLDVAGDELGLRLASSRRLHSKW